MDKIKTQELPAKKTVQKDGIGKFLGRRIFLFCILVLCITWGITLLVIQSEHRIEITQAYKETQNLASVLEKHISGILSQIEISLFSMRQTWESGISPEDMQILLNHFVTSRSDLFNLVSIIDVKGNVLLTDKKDSKPAYSGDRPFFIFHREHQDSQMRIGPPILGRVTQKWYIPVSIRLKDTRGQFAGVLLASVNPYYFSMIFQEARLGKDALVYLADSQGIIYSGMLGGKKFNLDKGIPPVEASRILSRQNASSEIVECSLDGVERVQSHENIRDRDMFVSVGIGVKEFLEPSYSRIIFLLMVQILFSIFIFIFLLRLRQALISKDRISKELEKSENKFKKIVENIPLAIGIADSQGNILYQNPAFKEKFGYDLEEIPAISVWAEKTYPDPVYREESLRVWENDIHYVKSNPERTSPSRVYRLTSKSGNLLDIEISFTLIDNKLYAVFHDITEQKKAEKELREKERRAVLQRAGIAKLVLDQTVISGELQDIFCRIIEVVSETIGIARVSIWTFSEDRLTLMCQALYESGKKAHYSGSVLNPEIFPAYFAAMMSENRVYAEDAWNDPRTEKLAEEYLKPLGITSLLDAGILIEGRLLGVISCEHIGPKRSWHADEEAFISTIAAIIAQFLGNIEKKHAEEAQHRAEEQYRLLVENQNDLIVKVDKENHFIYVSPSYCKTFGKTEEELLGKSFMPLVHEEDMENTQNEMKKLSKPPYTCILEQRALTKEGWRWFSWCDTAELDKNSQVISIIGVGRDITDRKRAEEEKERLQAELAQAQKMESVGRLAGGVAHDFNNMLGVILGQTELALSQMKESLPFYDNLQEIRKAAERSADLTRQLLAFARKQTVVPKVIDLNETVEGMLKMLKRLIGENIDLVWLPEKKAELIKIDPSQIDQILANLCVNARDAIKGVGKVTIKTVSVSCNEDFTSKYPGASPGEYVLLTVKDDGCGMSPEIQTHLFEPFFTTKELGKGTGLGLATIYGIVRQNNGFIHVESVLDQGTLFKIYLPMHESNEMIKSKDAMKSPLIGHETILLVEDEPMILKMTREMLKLQGYTVLSAATPEQAITIAREHDGKIHLLMTDVIMPGMNGHDLAKTLLSLYPSLKCLYMSGYAANVITDQGMLNEEMNFIQKPFALKDLSVKVRKALDNPLVR